LDAGAQVVAVLEGNRLIPRAIKHLSAMWGQWERIEEGFTSYFTMLQQGVPYLQGWGILEAHGSRNVESATIARLDYDWRPISGSKVQVQCDTICTGYGFLPFNSLSRQMSAQQVWNDAAGGIVPKRDDNLQTSLDGVYAVGDCAGIGGVRMSLIEGRIAGYSAAASLGYNPPVGVLERTRRQQRHEQAFQRLFLNLFTPGPGAYELAKDDTLICRCEGTTKKDIVEAFGIGASSTVELKSDTRCGMGECQGRFCEQSVLHLMQQNSNQPINANQGYHLRPPVFPLPLHALAQDPVVLSD
jgi:NADPH-dependent 2,4-dienoyl-CoA reductase/sulfur reductase-like enzyme